MSKGEFGRRSKSMALRGLWTKDKKQQVVINHAELVTALVQVETKGSVTLLFDVEGDQLECKFGRSGVMAPKLAAKYTNIKALTGTCTDGSTATLTVNTDKLGTFKVMIRKQDGVVFYGNSDNDDSDVISFFRMTDLRVYF